MKLRNKYHLPPDVEASMNSDREFKHFRGEDTADVLADTDVSHFAFIHHLFEFLPCRVRVRSQSNVQHVVSILLEGDRPKKIVRRFESSYIRGDLPVHEIQIEVLCA